MINEMKTIAIALAFNFGFMEELLNYNKLKIYKSYFLVMRKKNIFFLNSLNMIENIFHFSNN